MSVKLTNTKIQRLKQLVADVKDDGWYITYIENPPLEVQLAAVKNKAASIIFIDKPAAAVKRYVIRKTIFGYAMIGNPTEKDLSYHHFIWDL